MRIFRVTAAAAAMAVVALGATSGAQASVLWNNGGPAADGSLCSSNTATCNGVGWTIYDDFQLASASTITGFTYDTNFNSWGSSNDYVSTNWSIWIADPRSTWSAGPLISGTSVGANSIDSAGFTLTTVNGLNIALAPGVYWLGLQNNVDNGQITTYITSGQSRLGSASQSDNSGDFFNSNIPDASFTVEGGAVPEPVTWAMMLLGIGGIGLAMRAARRRGETALTAA